VGASSPSPLGPTRGERKENSRVKVVFVVAAVLGHLVSSHLLSFATVHVGGCARVGLPYFVKHRSGLRPECWQRACSPVTDVVQCGEGVRHPVMFGDAGQ
jgi:hypothetical protein